MMAAAAGYIINDIFDERLDWANRESDQLIVGKKLNISKVKQVYVFFTVLGFILAIILSINLDIIWIFGICPIIYILLYFYSSHLKCTILLGNVLVSMLTGLVMILPYYLNSIWLIQLDAVDDSIHSNIKQTFIALSIFAFLVNLIREIVKDQEDRMGDALCGCKTTAVGLGKNKTRILLIALLVMTFLIQIIFIYLDSSFHVWTWILCIAIPWLFNIIYFIKSNQQFFYRNLSLLLKIEMFLGLFYYIYRHYANNSY
ncbi:MAG: UbiA family prenyltransferase [Saprospiraceae bacterium]|nr:UbiA family prenyltransferase [Saprospiraceae bacterium]